MVPIDQDLLQGLARFFAESGLEGNRAYYATFEAILADAATHYSRLATNWYPILSSAEYVLKVFCFLSLSPISISYFIVPMYIHFSCFILADYK